LFKKSASAIAINFIYYLPGLLFIVLLLLQVKENICIDILEVVKLIHDGKILILR